MSADVIAPDPAARLAATLVVYEEIGMLKERLRALKTAEDARLAHEAALATEERAIASLRRDLDALRFEQRKRRLSGARVGPAAPPPPPRRAQSAAPASQAVVVERSAPPPSADRRKLKKIVSRWQFQWKLEATVLAQVNSIADDPQRPLGEALALFDRSVYEAAIRGESDEARAARLEEWQHVLESYVDHLRSEIDTVETRYRSVLGIWDRWRRASENAAGLAEWNLFIEKSREQKRGEIATLEADVTKARAELGL